MTAVTTTSPPRANGALRLGLARTGIEVRMFFRERDSMVFTFAFPVILLFIFGSVWLAPASRCGCSSASATAWSSRSRSR